MPERLVRWWGLLALAARRAASRAAGADSRQIGLHVAGIALPVALMLVVTGISAGLATGTTVRSPDVDYRIVPDAGTAESAVVSAGGPQLGRVHPVAARLDDRDDVEYATPVLLELLRLQAGNRSEFVLAVGVVPRGQPDTFAGVSAAALEPGDPYYANGRYDGRWTGEAVLSSAAAELLGAETGTALSVTGTTGRAANRTFDVVGVSRGEASAVGRFPVVVVHLAELQAITGAESSDGADQIVVQTDDPGVKSHLQGIYPQSLVVSGSGMTSPRASTAELPLALALAALVVAVAVGLLFAASTMGLAVADEGGSRALLAALGFSPRSRAALIAVQALVVSLFGGAVGVVLGAAGIVAANAFATRYVAGIPVADFHSSFVAYGLGVALLIGLLSVPYLLFVSRRTTTIAALTE